MELGFVILTFLNVIFLWNGSHWKMDHWDHRNWEPGSQSCRRGALSPGILRLSGAAFWTDRQSILPRSEAKNPASICLDLYPDVHSVLFAEHFIVSTHAQYRCKSFPFVWAENKGTLVMLRLFCSVYWQRTSILPRWRGRIYIWISVFAERTTYKEAPCTQSLSVVQHCSLDDSFVDLIATGFGYSRGHQPTKLQGETHLQHAF